MNRKFWKSGINRLREDGQITDEDYMAKLAEEFGEVARAQSERLKIKGRKNPAKAGIKFHTRNLIEELEHVEFMAHCWRTQIEKRWREDVDNRVKGLK